MRADVREGQNYESRCERGAKLVRADVREGQIYESSCERGAKL